MKHMIQVYILMLLFAVELKAQLNWTIQNPRIIQQNSIYDVHAIDQNTAVAVGENGIVMKTTDAGENWDIKQYNMPIYSVHFGSATTGWFVGRRKVTSVIFKTTNGGRSWNEIYGELSLSLYSLYFVDEHIGWVVGEGGKIFKTTDGGTSWNEQKSGINLTLRSVYFLNERIGWTVGHNGRIRFTTDGGDNWILGRGRSGFIFYSVCFVNSLVGWVAGSNDFGSIILKSINGGLDWIEQKTFSYPLLRYVYFKNAETGWVVGEDGQIRATNDGGTTWYIQTSHSSKYLYIIRCSIY